MKVLVSGAAGQLGMEIVRALTMSGDVDDSVVAVNHDSLDVSDRDAVCAMVDGVKPDAVVNCAAKTAVDACEADPDGTFRVNAIGVGYLAEVCAEAGVHFTTISTDYVFDGTKSEPYTENDPTNPLSVYGRSKLAGEWAALAGYDLGISVGVRDSVRARGVGVTVIRTSLVCGAYGSNVVKTVLAQLRCQRELRYVTDQVSCPTFAVDLAGVVLSLTRRRRTGLFHVTNQGVVSRFELAKAITAAAGADPGRVSPTTTEQLPERGAAALRPAYSALNNAALKDAGEPEPRHFTEPLSELVGSLLGTQMSRCW